MVFIAGTTAELIKLSPVLRELEDRGEPYRLWTTDQHLAGVAETLGDLGVRQPDRHLLPPTRRTHIKASRQVPGWVAGVLASVVRHRRELRAELRSGGGRGLVVVHGDTFTTVLGGLIGRFLGARVAHVEAGLRSGSLRNPFPEEVNRRLVGHLATLHFAPTPHDAANLSAARARGEIVVTGANTVVDALRLAGRHAVQEPDLPGAFGLVTLHRFELLRDGAHFAALLRTLAEAAGDPPLLFVAGQAEKARIAELGLDGLFGAGFRMIDKRPYARFLPILTRAAFVVTDSGGLQEECAALGVPCAVHRERTERRQGLGANVVLTELSLDRLRDFLREWPSLRRDSVLEELHPSRIVADHLLMSARDA
nr:UDP-N-acetyl glucosamine 2-epimerase [Propionibacterium sp.]